MSWRVERWGSIDGLEHGFGDRLNPPPPHATTLRQVHGRAVFSAPEVVSGQTEGDGLIAPGNGHLVGVWTADCVPVLLVAPGSRVAAAVHCGWRGSAKGILREAFDLFDRRFGIRSSSVEAALGPSIGGCCYEVGEEVREAFVTRAGPGLGQVGFESRNGKLHLDLRTFLDAELHDIGAASVERVGPCTACRLDVLHSYRREPGTRGRQLGWAGWTASC